MFVSDASFRGMVGVARQEITPPIGIHARNWGAAKHDVAEGVHRPLTLTAIVFGEPAMVLISADLMSWRSREAEEAVIGKILQEGRLPRERLLFCLSHTHAAPSVRMEDAQKPGGHLIERYQQQLVAAALRAIEQAQRNQTAATMTWRYGRCDLASNRDLPQGERLVVGFNPASPADDTLLVGRITADTDGAIVGTIVNYACHPTTLAWDNRLISPDYVGAMREIVEDATDGPCLFLQGASGELAPAEQYGGETSLADRHGRRLGHAVLATVEAMGPPGTQLAYDGVVESGAALGLWKRRNTDAIDTTLKTAVRDTEFNLKPMPALAENDDPVAKERLSRQQSVRRLVGDGPTTRVPLFAWRIGAALLLGQPNEAYSALQMELRRRFADKPVAVMNLVNGSIGYLPPRHMYEREVYAVQQTPFAAGSLERLIDASAQALKELA